MSNSIDLNLLIVFKALAESLNTTKAGKQLGLSQPAVSHALKRLRSTFDDDLFVRASRGLVPTPRALEILPAVLKILEESALLFAGDQSFDPQSSTRVFKIATTDYFETIALPGLLAHLRERAPGVQIITRPLHGSLPKEELEAGSIDLAIAGYFGALPEGYYKQLLFKDDFVCVSGEKKFGGKQGMSVKEYADSKHILISPSGDMKSKSEAILKRHGHAQEFVAGISSFSAPGWVVAETDYLLTCPRRLAQTFGRYLPVKVRELPFKMEEISVVQVWHLRNHKDPAHVWLRGTIKKTLF